MKTSSFKTNTSQYLVRLKKLCLYVYYTVYPIGCVYSRRKQTENKAKVVAAVGGCTVGCSDFFTLKRTLIQ